LTPAFCLPGMGMLILREQSIRLILKALYYSQCHIRGQILPS
jgi:hypothetical protein